MKLTTHSHLQPRVRMRGAALLFPYTPSWCGQNRLYLAFDFTMSSASKELSDFQEKPCYVESVTEEFAMGA